MHADDAQGIMDELMQQQPYIWHLGMIRCCDGISCKDGCKIVDDSSTIICFSRVSGLIIVVLKNQEWAGTVL